MTSYPFDFFPPFGCFSFAAVWSAGLVVSGCLGAVVPVELVVVVASVWGSGVVELFEGVDGEDAGSAGVVGAGAGVAGGAGS